MSEITVSTHVYTKFCIVTHIYILTSCVGKIVELEFFIASSTFLWLYTISPEFPEKAEEKS